jgi:putative flavoprotein involved in K+ transport
MSTLPASVDTVIVGAGHAGLIASWHLSQAGIEHLVLERRATLGGGWQDRWDAFMLVTPNELVGLPGFPFEADPEAFLTRAEIIDRTARYAEVIGAPVRTSVEVLGCRPLDDVGGATAPRFALQTSEGVLRARSVIVATGAFQAPRIPAAGAGLGSRVTQVHSHHYRRPADLPPGGVLIVGSGQTGMQLAEELFEAGRDVVLSVGRCGRVPRRYRGADYFHWIRAIAAHGPSVGVRLPRVDQLPDARLRFACNPHLSGHGGGHDTDLRDFARRGIRLAGRFQGGDGERVRFADDLAQNLVFADGLFAERFQQMFDRYIAAAGIDAPPGEFAVLDFEPTAVTELDLDDAGISTVLWTSGYTAEYGWLEGVELDPFGVPRHERGVSAVPGLTFLGLLWQLDNASANLAGVALDAAYLDAFWRA